MHHNDCGGGSCEACLYEERKYGICLQCRETKDEDGNCACLHDLSSEEQELSAEEQEQLVRDTMHNLNELWGAWTRSHSPEDVSMAMQRAIFRMFVDTVENDE